MYRLISFSACLGSGQHVASRCRDDSSQGSSETAGAWAILKERRKPLSTRVYKPSYFYKCSFFHGKSLCQRVRHCPDTGLWLNFGLGPHDGKKSENSFRKSSTLRTTFYHSPPIWISCFERILVNKQIAFII